MYVKNLDKLVSACIRLVCGASGESVKDVRVFGEVNTCSYYEGLTHDAIGEAIQALANLEQPFSLNYIGDCAGAIKALRMDILANPTGGEGDSLPPRAQEFWIMALAHLELAASHMQQCDYHRMQNQ